MILYWMRFIWKLILVVGKEYAVDKSMILAKEKFDFPMMINFGGDLCVNKKQKLFVIRQS